MSETVQIELDGQKLVVSSQATVAAVLLNQGSASRLSLQGGARGPLCGMGTCYECCVTIDGGSRVRACTVICRDGMEVRTGV